MGDYKINSLTNQILSLMESQPDFPRKLKQHLLLECNKVANPFKFVASLVNEGVLCDGSNDSEADFGLREIIVQLAVMIACAKGVDAIGGLMEALEASSSTQVISSLGAWVKEDFTNGVVRVADQQTEEQPVKPDFFEQASPSHAFSKVATFDCQAGASATGTLSLEFDKNRLIAHLADSTLKLWNWVDKEQKIIKFEDKVKLKTGEAITSFQSDDEILVVGTSVGTIHLFDVRTYEEKGRLG